MPIISDRVEIERKPKVGGGGPGKIPHSRGFGGGELARRAMNKKEEFAAMGIVPPRLRRDLPWLGITLLLGFGFLAGQIVVWNSLRHQGVYLVTNPSRSYFYLLTGTHAVHLAGGLVALLYAAAGRFLALKFESQRIAVEVTSWYWHYLAFLWFGIFALVHFARG